VRLSVSIAFTTLTWGGCTPNDRLALLRIKRRQDPKQQWQRRRWREVIGPERGIKEEEEAADD
jgi:hypothetical protein